MSFVKKWIAKFLEPFRKRNERKWSAQPVAQVRDMTQHDAQYHGVPSQPVLRASNRYRLSSSDPIFNSTIPYFELWMAELERVLTYHLFFNPTDKPNIPFIHLDLQEFDGVAYTQSWNGGKKITLSSSYLRKVSSNRRYAEISGVVLHEMTHALQYNGSGQTPSWLIEGIADCCRKKSFDPSQYPSGWGPQFQSPTVGYAGTAYFLDWIDKTFPNFLRRLNLGMRYNYSENIFSDITGKSMNTLWSDYKRSYGR